MAWTSGKKADVGHKGLGGILSTSKDFGWSSEKYGLSPNQLLSDTWLTEVPVVRHGSSGSVTNYSHASTIATNNTHITEYNTSNAVLLVKETPNQGGQTIGHSNTLWMARDGLNGNRLRNWINPYNHLDSAGNPSLGYTVKLYQNNNGSIGSEIFLSAASMFFYYKEGALVFDVTDTPTINSLSDNGGQGLWLVGFRYTGPTMQPTAAATDGQVLSYDSGNLVWTSPTSLGNGDVGTSLLANDSVTLDKMANITQGNIIYGDASGYPAYLAPGDANQVLTSNGTIISWQDPSTTNITIANEGDNRVITSTGSNGGLNAEANFTYDGTDLLATGNTFTFKNSGSGDATVVIHSDTGDEDEADNPRLWFKADGDITEAAIQHNNNTLDIINNVSGNGGIRFLTGETNNTGTNDPSTGASSRLEISSTGAITSNNIINTPSLNIGSSTAVDGVDDNNALGTSSSKLATQNAIKSYVDNSFAQGNSHIGNTDLMLTGERKLKLNGEEISVLDGNYNLFRIQTDEISFNEGGNIDGVHFRASNSGSYLAIYEPKGGGNSYVKLTTGSLSGTQTITLPNASGTIALTNQLTADTNISNTNLDLAVGSTKTLDLNDGELHFINGSTNYLKLDGQEGEIQIGGGADNITSDSPFYFKNGTNSPDVRFYEPSNYGTNYIKLTCGFGVGLASTTTLTLPNANGTVALTSQIPPDLTSSGAGTVDSSNYTNSNLGNTNLSGFGERTYDLQDGTLTFKNGSNFELLTIDALNYGEIHFNKGISASAPDIRIFEDGVSGQTQHYGKITMGALAANRTYTLPDRDITFGENLSNATMTIGNNGGDIDIDGKDFTVRDGSNIFLHIEDQGVETFIAQDDLDIGDHDFRAKTFTSDVAQGTSPFTVTSDTMVLNLRAQYAGAAGSASGVDVTDEDTNGNLHALTFYRASSSPFLDGSNSAALKSDSDLTYKPSTGTLYATNFSGALTGTALQATLVSMNQETSDVDYGLNFSIVGGGNVPLKVNEGLLYNPGARKLKLLSVLENKPTFTIENTHNSAGAGELVFSKLRADDGVAQGDNLGEIWFDGQDSAQNSQRYAYMVGEIDVGTSGQESGQLKFGVASHDGGTYPGLTITGGSSNNAVDVTIGGTTSSAIQINGDTQVSGDITTTGNITPGGHVDAQVHGLVGSSKWEAQHVTATNKMQGDIIYTGNQVQTTAGKVYYLKSDGDWVLAKATSNIHATSLMALATGTDSSKGMLVNGIGYLSADCGVNTGGILFLSDDNAGGKLTGTKPSTSGHFIRTMGYVLDDSGLRIYFNPDSTFIELD